MKKIVLIIVVCIVFLSGLGIYQMIIFSDKKMHMTFCNVGQGDAIYMRTPSGKDILVDGGPGDAVLSCLSTHMPFWDRHIDLVVLTHPHLDHLEGLISVMERYKVGAFATEKVGHNTAAYQTLLSTIEQRQIKKQMVYAGDRYEFADGVALRVVGPSSAFLEKTAPEGVIDESEGFGNVVTLVAYGNTHMLLPGDSQVEGIEDALKVGGWADIDVLQLPHHGSQSGIDVAVLKDLKPELAVISVGAKNKYGHPHPTILELLRKESIPFLRTDVAGDIELVSDGKRIEVKK